MSEHLRPHFFIIGERKCGTSSLYRYLLDHPNILPGPRKEMQFFTRGAERVEREFADYLRAFPKVDGEGRETLQWPELDKKGILYEEPLHFEREAGRRYITGEASADTLCDVPPALLRRYLPDLKLVAIFRDPVPRAFSHHRMFKRFQDEGRVLGFQVGDFAEDMRLELEAQRRGQATPCLSPGLYVHSLRKWNHEWKNSKPRVLFSEDLDDEQRGLELMAELMEFFELPAFDFRATLAERYNQAPPADMPEEIAEQLRAFYEPHDRALEAELGRPVPWRG